MLIILKGSEIVKKIIGKNKPISNIKYRKSIFCHFVKYMNKIIVLNNLTKEVIVLSDDNLKYFENVNYFDSTNIMSELIESNYLVELNDDEYSKMFQIRSMLPLFIKKDNIIDSFVIFPTLACNARCYYCFEYGCKKETMSNETANRVADYIEEVSKGSSIKIQWFGGEPLLNVNAIDIISKSLKERGIHFTSNIISNGYLFNDETITKAKDLWNLKSVQITLDGTKSVYNKTKNYIYQNDNNPFGTVLHNISRLLDFQIKVFIRINVDKNNIHDIYNLIDLINDKFAENEFLSIYAWPLYENRGEVKISRDNEERNQLAKLIFELDNYILSKGYYVSSPLDSNYSLNQCMADSDNSITILPNGNLTKCDHCLDDMHIGSIYSSKTDDKMIEVWKEQLKPIDLCSKCCLSIDCVRIKKCPDLGSYYCNEFEKKRKILMLENRILKTYELLNTIGKENNMLK